jgi:3-deoxy-D-manno-octulosonic-acid transferase
MLSLIAKQVSRPVEHISSVIPADDHASDRFGALCSRFYNILWYPALLVALAAAGDAESRRQRLGRLASQASVSGDRKFRVWVHAASVGEVQGVRPVVSHLADIRPDLDFVITTMTSAGRDAARRHLNGVSQLAPFDHAQLVRKFLASIRPVLLVVTETELWPNLFLESAAAGVRIALINARLSERSLKRYRLVRPIIARVLRSTNVVLAQTAGDAEGFRHLGAPPERVAVGGNSKYEISRDAQPLRPALASFATGRPILVAGSTAPDEEQVVLTAYLHLLKRVPSLALILAPRHLQRVQELERLLRSAGLDYTRASESNALCECRPPVLVLDTMGELGTLYKCATVAFVGGSLRPGRGGQSLAEPATASVPVLFGPYYENHRQLGDALIAAAAGRVVRDATELTDASAKWLSDATARTLAGQRARATIEQFAGGTSTIVRLLCALLPTS